jgi:hypothetical protein
MTLTWLAVGIGVASGILGLCAVIASAALKQDSVEFQFTVWKLLSMKLTSELAHHHAASKRETDREKP